MKILVDACSLSGNKTGIGIYTHRILSEMCLLSKGDTFFLTDAIVGGNITTIDKVRLPLHKTPLLRVMETRFPFMTICRLLLRLRRLATGMTSLKDCDIFFGTNFRGVFREGMKTVLTVHDMVHEYYPETVEEVNLNYYRTEFPAAVARADLLIAVSKETKRDILKFLPVPEAKVKVIYNGVDERFRPVSDPALRAAVADRYRLPERFILMVGSIQPRKNIDGVLLAMASLVKNGSSFPWKLVLAGGGGWKNEGLAGRIRDLGLTDRVHFTGYVADEDLPVLYSLADLFVFPSLYEGFGLPVVEAMACGVPVVTSDSSCLPEVAGDAAVLVNPHDIEDIANGMQRLLEDLELRARCVRLGIERARLFSWKTAAQQTLQAFHELASV